MRPSAGAIYPEKSVDSIGSVKLDLTSINLLLSAVNPLVAVVRETDAILRRKLGTAFRYADYAIGGYEVRLNRLLRDLLDPCGPHGQGASFLERLLKTLEPDLFVGDLTKWTAKNNFPTKHGRLIDIFCFGPDSTAVGIECKPWAEESDSQLEDYATISWNDLVLKTLGSYIFQVMQSVPLTRLHRKQR